MKRDPAAGRAGAMQTLRQWLGARGENLACRELRRHGLRVLRRNYRVRGGEIDLVARDGEVLVFVEVRVRSHAAWGGAAASVDRAKRARLLHAARCFLGADADGLGDVPCRFDVVAIDGARVRWIRDAFDSDG